jgi:peptidoglycan/LPS O-acetylase OafA/YrhL
MKSGYTDLTLETDRIVAAVTALILTGVFAEISYRMIETPLRTYGARLSKAKFKQAILAN